MGGCASRPRLIETVATRSERRVDVNGVGTASRHSDVDHQITDRTHTYTAAVDDGSRNSSRVNSADGAAGAFGDPSRSLVLALDGRVLVTFLNEFLVSATPFLGQTRAHIATDVFSSVAYGATLHRPRPLHCKRFGVTS